GWWGSPRGGRDRRHLPPCRDRCPARATLGCGAGALPSPASFDRGWPRGCASRPNTRGSFVLSRLGGTTTTGTAHRRRGGPVRPPLARRRFLRDLRLGRFTRGLLGDDRRPLVFRFAHYRLPPGRP